MASGLLTDYLKHGLAADRPVTPELYTEAFGLWWSDDTQQLDLWNGIEWLDDIVSGGIPDAPSDGSLYARMDAAWAVVPDAVTNELELITEAGAFTADPGTHSGRQRLILAGGDITFNTTSISAGQCYNIRSTGAVTLMGSGLTLVPTDGGSLGMVANMQVTVVITSPTTAIVMGLTVSP